MNKSCMIIPTTRERGYGTLCTALNRSAQFTVRGLSLRPCRIHLFSHLYRQSTTGVSCGYMGLGLLPNCPKHPKSSSYFILPRKVTSCHDTGTKGFPTFSLPIFCDEGPPRTANAPEEASSIIATTRTFYSFSFNARSPFRHEIIFRPLVCIR